MTEKTKELEGIITEMYYLLFGAKVNPEKTEDANQWNEDRTCILVDQQIVEIVQRNK